MFYVYAEDVTYLFIIINKLFYKNFLIFMFDTRNSYGLLNLNALCTQNLQTLQCGIAALFHIMQHTRRRKQCN